VQPLLVAGLRLTGFRTLRIRKEHIVSDRAARADDTTVAGTTFRPSISVVVPALNEQKTLRKTVIWTHEVLASQPDDHEIIVVDDGSTDDTGAIADALSAELPSVRVIHTGRPSGYGGVLNTGFRQATKDVITIITADGEFLPTDIPKFLAEMQRTGADVVTSTVPNRPYPFYRKVLSWGWRRCIKTMIGECPTLEGLFLIRRTLFTELNVTSTSGMWAMELLILARRKGATFGVIPTSLRPREDLRESKVANLATIIKVFRDILDLRRRLS
jgi:glycosyltransferase involved in cell wall biosynthesis